jgi:hypothetical protein
MGWKSVKEHYRIEHIVHIDDEWSEFERKMTGNKRLCIGSAYVRDLISFNLTTGEFKTAMSINRSGPLQRYWHEMHADLDLLRELLGNPDTFEKSIPVFTFDGGDILEKQCEEIDWPNVTHDGVLMDSRFFPTRDEAVKRAIENAESAISSTAEHACNEAERLHKIILRMQKYAADLAKLKTEARADGQTETV